MRTLVVTLCLALAAAGPALAKPGDETSAAREHYKRGTTLYDLGKYEDAIVEFQQAYEIKDDPVLLYNIAQSYRLSNKYQEALRFYKTYLRRAPKAPNRDEVETKIADMENLIAQQQRVATMPSQDPIPPRGDKPANIGSTTPATRVEPRPEPVRPTTPTTTPRTEPEPEPAVTQPTTRPPETRPEPAVTETKPVEAKPVEAKPTEAKPSKALLFAGIGVAGAGLVAAVAGIALGAVASGNARAQEKLATEGKPFDPSLESSGKTFGVVGPVLAGVGGVLVVGGAALAVVGVLKSRPAEKDKVTFTPSVGPGLVGGELSLRF